MRSTTFSRNRVRFGQAGQRVVIGLVAKLFLEPGELGQGLLQVAVLERDGGLVRERLEEPQVVLAEHRPFGQSVADDQRADRLGLAAQGADHVSRDPPVGIVRLLEERRARAADALVQRVLRRTRGRGP